MSDFEHSYEGCYGKPCKASVIVSWIDRLCGDNADKLNTERWTGNIWGHPGVGKTSLVKQLTNHPVYFKGKKYPGYKIIDIPLAQIEEMGDILGVPDDYIEMSKFEEVPGGEGQGWIKQELRKWILAKEAIMTAYLNMGWKFVDGSNAVTRYAKPDWVPTEECPGIIIFDDANRASIRILKGLMQLIQNYRTIAWEIPAGWNIIFTGNPDTQNYLVQAVDQAILTREKHITMIPDAREWSLWAENNGVDPRGINFILRMQEVIRGGVRTNMRTLTEFFKCTKKYQTLETKRIAADGTEKYHLIDDVHIDGMSLIDEETLTQFVTFVSRDMKLIIEPDMVLNDVKTALDLTEKLMTNGEARVDIIGVTCDRLVAYMFKDAYKIQDHHINNFQEYLTCKYMPDDLRHSVMKRIADSPKTELQTFLLNNKAIHTLVKESLRMTI